MKKKPPVPNSAMTIKPDSKKKKCPLNREIYQKSYIEGSFLGPIIFLLTWLAKSGSSELDVETRTLRLDKTSNEEKTLF